MLEWFGVCCCSSFVSCICSLIASALCLTPGGTKLRGSMNGNGKIGQKVNNGECGNTGRESRGRNGNKRRSSARSPSGSPNSGSSYCSPQACAHGYPPNVMGLSYPPNGMPPGSSPGQPYNMSQQRPGYCSSPTENEIRKCIDEYNIVFKQFNDLMIKETIRQDAKNTCHSSKTSTSGGVTATGTTSLTDGTSSGPQVSSKKTGTDSGTKRKRRKSCYGRSSSESKVRTKEKERERDSKGNLTDKKTGGTTMKSCECERPLQRSSSASKGQTRQKSVDWVAAENCGAAQTTVPEVAECCCTKGGAPTARPSWGTWNQKLQKTVRRVCDRVKRGEGEKCCECEAPTMNQTGNSRTSVSSRC